MSLIFSSTKKQKIVKTISACTESTYLLCNKPLKNYSSRDTILLAMSPLKGPSPQIKLA